MMFLFDIGFMNIRIWDILDILIVAYFMYLIYKLLRGTIAFNIIIGVIILYAVWWIVNMLKMRLLVLLLGKFVAFGVIILIIIFQPEVRKFLLYLGNSTLKGRLAFLRRYFDKNFVVNEVNYKNLTEIKNAILSFSRSKTGALIVFTSITDPVINEKNGVLIKGEISEELIKSIFNKCSPLHDGAMVIIDDKIYSASVILPISTREDIPTHFGTRHRAALGYSEISEGHVFVVSEETGKVSYAYGGKLYVDLSEDEIFEKLIKIYE